MEIRPLELSDVAPCIHLGEEMHAQSVMAQWNLDREKAAFMLNRLVDMPQAFCWGAFEGDEIHAALIGVVEDHIFIDVKVAKDYGFYARRTPTGVKGALGLLAAFESWATASGAGVVFIEVSSGISDEHTIKLLKRLGFERTGAGMRKAAA